MDMMVDTGTMQFSPAEAVVLEDAMPETTPEMVVQDTPMSEPEADSSAPVRGLW
jgi:hypothetical protein